MFGVCKGYLSRVVTDWESVKGTKLTLYPLAPENKLSQNTSNSISPF